MIPLHLKAGGMEEPTAATYYLVAANGAFLVRRTELFASVTKARSVVGLEEQAESLTLSFPRLPRHLLEITYGFFRLVHRRLRGEAIVFIYFSRALNEFRFEAPPQVLTRHRTRRGWRTAGKVEYRTLPRPDGFLKLGDVHSHGDCAAFFSATDDRDDAAEDGLRIVMGRLHQPKPDVQVSFVINRTRFPLDVNDVLEEFSEPAAPPQRWIRRVSCSYERASPNESVSR
jgi:PRTRC genetic system protein A